MDNKFDNMVRHDRVYKFLLLGDPSVGKTCLLMRYTDNNFERNYISTIGLDFRIKTLNYKNKNLKIQVWDTAGQERYLSMTKTYFKGANAILLIYDTTSISSFKNTERWLEHIRNNSENDNLVLILVGNKIDLSGARQVSSEMGKKLAEKNDIKLFIETSAKDDVNVEKCFNLLIERVFNISSTSLPTVENIKIAEVEEKKKKCC
jgi:Ras-related protein Rab-18